MHGRNFNRCRSNGLKRWQSAIYKSCVGSISINMRCRPDPDCYIGRDSQVILSRWNMFEITFLRSRVVRVKESFAQHWFYLKTWIWLNIRFQTWSLSFWRKNATNLSIHEHEKILREYKQWIKAYVGIILFKLLSLLIFYCRMCRP